MTMWLRHEDVLDGCLYLLQSRNVGLGCCDVGQHRLSLAGPVRLAYRKPIEVVQPRLLHLFQLSGDCFELFIDLLHQLASDIRIFILHCGTQLVAEALDDCASGGAPATARVEPPLIEDGIVFTYFFEALSRASIVEHASHAVKGIVK